MKYQLLALDVDGTLVPPDNVVRPETVEAVRAATDAGLRVCLATGRSYAETMPVWRQLGLSEPHEPLVLIGGSLVAEPVGGRTLYHRPIEAALACEFADALGDEGYAAMVIVDVWRHGVDYYVAESGDEHDAQRRWFEKMDVSVRRVPRLADAEDMPPPLRVSTVADADRAGPLAERLRERFEDRLNLHAILAPNYGITIVEAFAVTADKFEAIRYVAQAHDIPASRIAAVGDDVNDLAMIRGAGLGAAMPNASRPALDAADVTAEPSLTAFIHDLLAGRYDG